MKAAVADRSREETMSSIPKRTFSIPLMEAQAPETTKAATNPTSSRRGVLFKCREYVAMTPVIPPSNI